MKRMTGIASALLLAALIFVCAPVSAQELTLGDLVYVPAMSALEGVGSIGLTVEGLVLQADSDEPLVVSPLAGAEFGVYVYSSAGVLTPWANPLFPSERMRIRTGEGETFFSLPIGSEFYLKQENAPQGYLFDSETLIPVTGDHVLVQNATPGQLVVRVEDELGAPLQGVEVAFSGPYAGTVTDENGEAVLTCDGIVSVAEGELAQNMYEAVSARVEDAQGPREVEPGQVQAQVKPAARSYVTFVHPAAGVVRVRAALAAVGDDGEILNEPLAGVRLSVEGGEPVSIVTNEEGEASLALLEGAYNIRMDYEGAENAILPASEGQLIIRKGEETAVELAAVQSTGRITVQTNSARKTPGGAVMIEREADGRQFGPYAFDENGRMVSEPLEAGTYRIAAFEAPPEMELARVIAQEQAADDPQDLHLEVKRSEATHVQAEVLTWESQSYALLAQTLDDDGKPVYGEIDGAIELALLNERDEAIGGADAEQGRTTISALSGVYSLRMDEAEADRLGLCAQSLPFTLPADGDGTVVFRGNGARLALSSVDENGIGVPGATYRVTDGAGNAFTVTTGEDAAAVTPLLVPGEVTVQTLQSPADHAAAASASVHIQAGEAPNIELAHPSYGEALISVSLRGLDARGVQRVTPLPGVSVVVEGDGLETAQEALVSGEDGLLRLRLPEGEYVVRVDEGSLGGDMLSAGSARLSMRNTEQTPVELVCTSALGGVNVTLRGGELSAAEMAQVRFELEGEDGASVPLTLQDRAFYAGGLPAGEYTLRQTRIPAGYSLASERTVSVTAGEAAAVEVPLEEYAVLTVNKTGLTFDDRMQTFVVPLAGEYGVYTMEGDEMLPYPSADGQATVWANVTPEQIAQGCADSVRLPAGMEGRTYYLHELSDAEGFSQDEAYHEVTLYAGVDERLECTVSSDRGFFSLEQTDASGEHAVGGAFELVNGAGEAVLSFTMGEEAYQNPMAIPVGVYTIRQLRAAEGCALPMRAECEVTVEPYLSKGGTVTRVSMPCARIPQNAQLSVLTDLYAAREQELTTVSVDASALAAGETLRMPRLTLDVSGENGERVDVISIVLSGATDAVGGAYAARVEYCLSAGGWRPSDARLVPAIDAPFTVSLADVQDDVCAVRVTYLDAKTGLENVGEGFAPGNVSIGVRAGIEGGVRIQAEAAFDGIFDYVTELGGETKQLERTQQMRLAFDTQGDGAFDTALAGRDGRISGLAFLDADADGQLSWQENERLSGVGVFLLDANGNTVDEQMTDADGRYAFDSLSAGTYTVRFDAGEGIVFSSGDAYSEHVSSGVRDARNGLTRTLALDSNCTDAVVLAGCVHAAHVTGWVAERTDAEALAGYSGLNAELLAMHADGTEDEPSVVLSDDTGEFGFDRLMPGRYELIVNIPDGYLCAEAQDGQIVRDVELGQGEELLLDQLTIQRAASVSGSVYIDGDGDGAAGEDASLLGGVKVSLLRADEGHTEPLAQTVTGPDGRYAFEGLADGAYCVLFELSDEWTFTRYGKGSLVFGAMAQSGSTQNFEVAVGQRVEHIDAGVTVPMRLNVLVFQDTQADGEYNGSEPMLEGAGVTLARLEDGVSVQELYAVTDANGTAAFTGVGPGTYRLLYQLPGAWRATVNRVPDAHPVSCVPQSTQSVGQSEAFSLIAGQNDLSLYIGAMLTGSIAGTVYYDDDADASCADTEGPAAGVLVELIDMQEQTLSRTTSGSDGGYAFEGLAPGKYRVRFTSMEDGQFSASERSMSRGGVQQSEGPVSSTRTIAVYAGEGIDTADASLVRYAAVSGVIWEDRDADGLREEGEPGLAGVEVHLMSASGRVDVAGTTTGIDGAFSFTHVLPGEYLLRADTPGGYVFSASAAGSVLALERTQEQKGFSVPFALMGNAAISNVGYGMYRQGAISGRIWDDADYDGVMGEGESGLRYASVTLRNALGEAVATAQTGRDGFYTFDGLKPGDYAIAVTVPQGYVYTAEGADSVSPRQNESISVVQLGALGMGQTISGVNVGALLPSTVGGVAWYDAGDDGRRQNDEAGVQNVGVKLIMLSGADAGKGFETRTDALGKYSFAGVMPGLAKLVFTLGDGCAFSKQISGSERVSVVPPVNSLTGESAAFAVGSGEALAKMDVGVVGAGVISGVVWEDSAYDGKRGASEAGIAGAAVSLLDVATGETVLRTQSGADGAYTLDFVRQGSYALEVALPDGRIFTCAGESAIANIDTPVGRTEGLRVEMGDNLTGLNVGAIAPAVLTGRILIGYGDGAASEAGEGLADAVVTAMHGGTVVATAKSGPDGAYALEALRPGAYRVRVALPQDTLFALDTPLTVADARAQEGESEEVTLAMGERRELEPVAAVKTGSVAGYVWEDTNADGLVDASESALAGVPVALYALGGDGTTTLALRTVTGMDGRYELNLIRGGMYTVCFTLPDGMLFADQKDQPGASRVVVEPGSVGSTDIFSLAPGQSLTDFNAGGILPGCIGDTVWLDVNANGLQDYREPPAPGVSLVLLHVLEDGTREETARLVSDEYGYYHFDSLRPGSYVLKSEDARALTLHYGEPLGEIDSDLDPQTAESGVITLQSGQTLLNVDVGILNN